MLKLSQLKALARSPKSFLERNLAAPKPASGLFLGTVTPLCAIRPVAVFAQSALSDASLPGFILGLGSLALQIGTWLGLSLVLPALARQFHAVVDDRQAFVLVTYASIPWWLAGLLFVVPEDPAVFFVWSRALVGAAALYGLYLTRLGMLSLGVRRSMRVPLLGSIAVFAAIIHGVLFGLLGVGAHIALFVLGG